MEECNWYDIPCHLTWLQQELKSFFLWVLSGILDAVVSVLDLIPVPDFISNISSYSVPSEIAYFLDPFEIPLGLSIIVSAYSLRFIIRRIPVIG